MFCHHQACWCSNSKQQDRHLIFKHWINKYLCLALLKWSDNLRLEKWWQNRGVQHTIPQLQQVFSSEKHWRVLSQSKDPNGQLKAGICLCCQNIRKFWVSLFRNYIDTNTNKEWIASYLKFSLTKLNIFHRFKNYAYKTF